MILRWWDFIDAIYEFNYTIFKKIFPDKTSEDWELAVDHYYDVEALIRGLLKFAYNAS